MIGRSANVPDVIHAFGHGHVGLTQSSATASLVAELLTRQNPSLDLSPFDPGRFRSVP